MAANDQTLSDSEKERYLNIYLVEYEVLSTRLTYWLTLQYVPYGIAAVALGYFVQNWRPDYPHVSPNLAWANLLILQLLMWAVLQSTHEVFTYVVYFKERLIPQICQLLPDDGPSVLQFETFLNALRRRWFLRFETTCGLLVLVVIGMIAAAWIALSSTPPPRLCRVSSMWILCNLYVLFILSGKIWDIGLLQRRAAG